MGPWVDCECREDGARAKIGGRVESFYASDPNDVHMRGILLGVRGDGTHVVLGDPDNDHWPHGHPVTFRADQVRPEVPLVNRVRDSMFRVQRQMCEIEQEYTRQAARRFRWSRPIPPGEQPGYLALLAAHTALQQSKLVHERLDRDMDPPKNVADEIAYETADGITENDAVIVDLNERGRNHKVECTFLLEFRGWRFIQFQHGGIHAYRAESVTAKRPRGRRKAG